MTSVIIGHFAWPHVEIEPILQNSVDSSITAKIMPQICGIIFAVFRALNFFSKFFQRILLLLEILVFCSNIEILD
jgi:hypothetical protein